MRKENLEAARQADYLRQIRKRERQTQLGWIALVICLGMFAFTWINSLFWTDIYSRICWTLVWTWLAYIVIIKTAENEMLLLDTELDHARWLKKSEK